MKKILFLLCLPIATFGQMSGLDYHKVSFKLDSLLIIAKDTGKYILEYERLPLDSLMETEFFIASKVYSRKRNYKKFQTSVKKSFEAGQTSEVIINYNSRIPEKEKIGLLDLELEMKKKYFSKVPKEVYDGIKNLVVVDSRIRDLNMRRQVNDKVVKTVDSLTLLQLHSIIQKHGMITERKHGALFNDFFYLILHCAMYNYKDHEWMRKLFYKAVIDGDARPDLYAYFVDRFEVINKREQIYGSMTNSNAVKDWKRVDQKRKEIGTCNLWNWKLLRKGRF